MDSAANNTHADLSAVALLDEPVRRRLYDWVIDQQRPVGREEAARAVDVSRALATFHLDRLAEGGLLETGYKRLSGRSGPGAGRPARVYWRAAREIAVSLPPRNYERMAELFAQALSGVADGAAPEQLIAAARSAGARIGDGKADLCAALDEAGYEPVTDEDGTIRLRNCPFHGLVEEHRSLVCGTNLAMAEGIAESVESGAGAYEAHLDPQPGYCCVAFTERAKEPRPADA